MGLSVNAMNSGAIHIQRARQQGQEIGRMQLLLIEDDRACSDWLAERLAGSGFKVSRAASKAGALETVASAEAIVIDLGARCKEACDTVQKIREDGFDQPLLILSPQGSWREKVDCLNAGADDFMVKPVRAEEIAARLHAIIRRFAGCSTERMRSGDAEIDVKARRAWIAGEPLDLTRNEFRLMRLFLMRPERFLSSDELLERLYANKRDRGINTVEVQIARLRRKIGKDRIQTLRGVGYRLVSAPIGNEPHPGTDAIHFGADKNITLNQWFPQI
jgi:two-component system OmpR family response regulator